MKVQKVEGRAEYLRHVLSKTVAAEVLDKPNLTYSDVMNASSQLLELWNLTRKPDVDRALGQPAGQAAAKQSKDANAFRRFATGAGWSNQGRYITVVVGHSECYVGHVSNLSICLGLSARSCSTR
jgi:hypothetical protein